MFPVQETHFLEQGYAYCIWLVRLTVFRREEAPRYGVQQSPVQAPGTRDLTITKVEGKPRTSKYF